jgi:hypothetical protein
MTSEMESVMDAGGDVRCITDDDVPEHPVAAALHDQACEKAGHDEPDESHGLLLCIGRT